MDANLNLRQKKKIAEARTAIVKIEEATHSALIAMCDVVDMIPVDHLRFNDTKSAGWAVSKVCDTVSIAKDKCFRVLDDLEKKGSEGESS